MHYIVLVLWTFSYSERLIANLRSIKPDLSQCLKVRDDLYGTKKEETFSENYFRSPNCKSHITLSNFLFFLIHKYSNLSYSWLSDESCCLKLLILSKNIKRLGFIHFNLTLNHILDCWIPLTCRLLSSIANNKCNYFLRGNTWVIQ